MKILVIDDDIFFQRFYIAHLREIGYEVESASNGEEGLNKIKTIKPDLVLLDLIMPKKDGFEVLTAVATDQTIKQIPILVFSTLGQEKEIQEAQRLGAVGYINKGMSDFDAAKTTIATILKK